MGLTCTVVSIGTLSRNRFWGEADAKRVAHATTVLARDGSTSILVDPSLPSEVLAQRLDERTGLKPQQVDCVFLTCFRPIHRRALRLFEDARWLMHEPEIEAMRARLDELAASARESDDQELRRLLEDERSLLGRIEPAEEKLTRRVHLFPCRGVTPGAAGLLLSAPTGTIVVAGDAVVTRDYFESGRVFEQVADVAAAQESFQDILEIADEIVPGHDNVFRVIGR